MGALVVISSVILGTIICIILDNIRIELKYRNRLLEEQNELIKGNNKRG